MEIILASNNSGKLRELRALFANSNFAISPQSEVGVREIAEVRATFVENAIDKARNASSQTKLPAVADDSGLVVDALDGSPGIYSARYAGENSSDEENIEKLLQAMQNVPIERRQARFYCVMVFLRSATDPMPIICQGIWEGSVLFSPRGKNGFGYDPIFFVPEYNCSSAELSMEIKNQISHRGQALRKLADILSSQKSYAKYFN